MLFVWILPKTIPSTTSCIHITSWEMWFQGNIFLLPSPAFIPMNNSLKRYLETVYARPCSILTGHTQNTLWHLPLNIIVSITGIMNIGCWDCNNSTNGWELIVDSSWPLSPSSSLYIVICAEKFAELQWWMTASVPP